MVIEVVKMISDDEAKGKPDHIGGLGGWFKRGMRWHHYVEELGQSEHAEAFRAYVLEHKLKHGGDWHQAAPDGVPLFSDGSVACFSFRAWGDFMAAVWSEVEDRDYNYMSFYMEQFIEGPQT